MDRELNPHQVDVLHWLGDHPEGPEPPGNWKASAVALKNRGLVSISRQGGKYRASPTTAGRYYREHGS